ncbi:MAG TPA: ATP-dependent DNA helicase RecG [Candidatus Limnocylindria bacterium]|jgi:ATP-dependent DNA helicase RecG|nr:ATP-dependent DNA helicase RecG [Candidatus Limnocylindria bacterium]
MTVVSGTRPLTAGELDQPLPAVMPELARGIAPLSRLGIETPRQALFHLPFRYDDFSELRSLGELLPDEKQSARARVTDVKLEKGFGRRPQRVIAQLADDTGTAEAVWFGRRFVENRLHAGDELLISGKVQVRGWRPQFLSPEFSPAGRASIHTGRVVPVYPLTAGVTQKRLRELLARILARALPAIQDPLLPAERDQLPALAEALYVAHFPEDAAEVPSALDRLAFDELLALQLTLAQARHDRESLRAARIEVSAAEHDRLVAALPFTLTDDQSRAVDEVFADLAAERPMRRLLQGDVGSGKTAVAALALAGAVRAGWQGALMAPTEILARQHHIGLQPLLEALDVRAEFLSGSVRAAEKRRIHDAIGSGEIQVVIGTHAVISQAVEFQRLGLAVVDEQHRFGVAQRAALQAKGAGLEPHLLALTATPIPRTLALTFYGDLVISTLHELPPGRQPIRTEIRGRLALPRIQQFIAVEAAEGRQVFVVVPLITESDALTVANAEAEFERLSGALPGLRVGLVHGQQRADDRDETMQRFAAGALDVLVATTVIEVGIDVPNASVMLIEDAERFGLAQLHQLRGRVGRGPHRSFCILLSDAADDRSMERLEVVRGSSDGFRIAEEDLRLRGAGNLLGTRQSGMPPLRVASLFEPRHLALAERARDLADGLVADDPQLARRPELLRLRDEFTSAEDEGDAA